MQANNSTNNQSQTPMSHNQLHIGRNSSSPIQRQMQHPNHHIQNPNYIPTHQQLNQSPNYRTSSPAPSLTNSDVSCGTRYLNPSFQGKQHPPPFLASIHSARHSPIDEGLPSSTFQPHQYHPVKSSGGDRQGNISISNLKTNQNKINSDCRLTINPVAKYAIKNQEDPQSWAPLLKAAQQESTL